MGRPGKKADRLDEGSAPRADASQPNLRQIHTGIANGLTPEASYTSAIPLAHRRRYAQFFTPPKLAKLMAEWAITSDTNTLLEPAFGMGALARAAWQRNPHVRITAFEKDLFMLRAYLEIDPDLSRLKIFSEDFLTSKILSHFDSVLMNPPYLRHHDLNYDVDIFEQFSRLYDLTISRLSNAYLLFTIKACMLLRPGGRAAIIIPTEWMNANFGSSLKKFLVERGFLREIIYFSSCSDIFDGALTTACVLLLERP